MKNLGRKFIGGALFLAVVLNFGCGAGQTQTADSTRRSSELSGSNTSAVSANTATVTPKSKGGGGGGREVEAEKISLEEPASNTPTVERKIIRNANMTLEVNAPADVQQKIASIAEAKGGFVVTSETQQKSYGENSTGVAVTLTLRVPANQFDATLAEIRQTANQVKQEKISGQDVTEEFIDIEARLKTKKALEAQFLEIMKQAKTVDDALSVQRELAEVRGEIEQIEGRYKFLQNQTNLSTINLTIQTPAPFASTSSGFGYQLGRAFSDGIDGALFVVLFLIRAFLVLLPLIVLCGVPLWLLIRWWKKRRTRQKLAQEFAGETKNQ